MVFDFLHFLFNLILAGLLLRFIQMKTAGSDFGTAIAYIY